MDGIDGIDLHLNSSSNFNSNSNINRRKGTSKGKLKPANIYFLW